jgi:diguanylate cyclase (GGDEF)-like protein
MDSKRWILVAALLAFLAAGTVAHLLAMLFGGDAFTDFANAWLYYAILVASAAACLLRAVTVPRDRLAWALIGLGAASWAAGDISYTLVFQDDPNAPYPSLSDFLYLADYPLTAAGVLVLTVGGARRLRGTVLLDGAIAGLGAAAVGAALMGPALRGYATSDPTAAIVDAAYPIGDMVIVGGAAAAAVILGWRRDFVLLALGLISMAVADASYLYAVATTGYVDGQIYDTAWVLAATLIGFAAWQPGKRAVDAAPDVRAVALPGLAVLAAIALLVIGQSDSIPLAGLLAGLTLLLAVARMVLALAENTRLLDTARTDALTDALTGIGNRRHLVDDLDLATASAARGRGEYLLAIFDLDGFKGYNDTFGHGAGDMLLRRLGSALDASVPRPARAYRLGGDEFCVLAPLRGASKPDSIIAAAAAALREDGEGFTITSSRGRALIPREAQTPAEALRLADRRLYADKGTSSRSFEFQARDLLFGVLRESEPRLEAHMEGVGELARRLARRSGLDVEEVDVIGRAAELHDIGKVAIPDEILAKPGPLTGDEWALMRTHTLIGERMLSVAPALAPVARLVRSSHERWDGDGYPDGLSGTEIPIGARIIAICDAFEAMIEALPHSGSVSPAQALEELLENAGSQFDPELVESFALMLAAEPAAAPVGRP